MRKDVIDFCNNIRCEYWKYLYETQYTNIQGKEEYVDFPVCCRVSAALITAFLQDCFSVDDFGCYYSKVALHGFTMCKQNEKIIDFTDFQFLIKDDVKEAIKNHDYNYEELMKQINEYSVVVDYCNAGFVFHDMAREIDLTDYPFIRRKRKLTTDAFFIFLKENFGIAAQNVKYDY